MKFKKQIFKIKLLSIGFVALLILIVSVTSFIYATVTTDDYTDELSVNEMLGSEITGGELINTEFQGGDVLLLDGVNDNVVVSDNASIDMGTSDFSIAMRVKRTGSGTGDYVISKLDGGGSGYSIQVKDAAIRVVLNGSSGTYNEEFSTDTNTGEWIDLVWSVDKSESDGSKIYRNGQLVGSGNPSSTGNIDTSYALVMGEWKDGGGYYFKGAIADVRLYKSRALTAQEVLDLHTYNSDIGSTGLQAWWKLDEGTGASATDSAGSNTGTIDGASWISGYLFPRYSRTTSINLLATSTSATLESFAYTTTKKAGDSNGRVQFSTDYDTDRENVLDFDGDGDYVDVGNSLEINPTTALTITTWFKAESLESADSNNLVTRHATGSNWVYIFRVQNGDIRILMQNQSSTSASVTGDSVSLNQWHFAAARYNGSEIELFLDGESQGTASLSGNLKQLSTETYIGSRDGNGVPDDFFDGQISDVRLYSEALTDQELLDLYNYNIKPDSTNLKGHWKLDEGTGTSVADNTSNGHTGTITGASWDTDKDFASLIANWVNEDNSVIDDKGAYEFDGTDDYVSVGDISQTDSTALTIAQWVRLDSLDSSHEVLLSKNAQYIIQKYNNNLEVRFGNGTSWIINSGEAYVPLSELSVGQWYHVVASTNGSGSTKFYLNGRLLRTVSDSSFNTGTGSASLTFGAYHTPSSYFDGAIGDIRLYSEALSDSEVWNLYAYATEPDDTNLEGHWKFNGNALDSSVNGNDGTVNGATANIDWNSRPPIGYSLLTDAEAQAPKFDAINDYVDTNFTYPTTGLPSENSLSACAWFYMDASHSGMGRIVGNSTGSSSTDSGGWFLAVHDNGTLYAYLRTGSSGGWTEGTHYIYAYAVDAVEINTWHHGCATWDGTNWKVFVDGREYDSRTVSSDDTVDALSDIVFGKREPSNDHYFNGKISNVGIFNDALTSSEIETLFFQGYIPTNHDHLLAYYPLAEDYADKTGVNGTATNNGSTLVYDIGRPQPEEPTQQTIDITNIGPMAAVFDGTNDYIEIPDDSSISFGDSSSDSPFSVGLWANMDDASNARFIFKRIANNVLNIEWNLTTSGTDKLLVQLFDSGSSANLQKSSTDSITADEGSWHYYSFTYDGSSSVDGIKLYRDGIEITDVASSTAGSYVAMHDYDVPITLGVKNRDSSPDYFDGSMANVSIWNDVRTASEVLTDYQNRTVDTSDANLVSHWSLNGNYNDSIGSNHGSPKNGAYLTHLSGSPGAVSSFNYRTFFTTDDGLGSYALGEITLTATTTGAAAATPALTAGVYGKQISYATTTTGIQLGGAFSLLNATATSTIDTIKFDQIGSLDGDYIDNLTLNYYTVATSTPCEITQPGSGLTQLGSASDLENGSTTITTNLDVGADRTCLYLSYDLDSADEYTEIGKSIDLVIAATSSLDISTGDDVALDATPLNIFGKTILAQAGVQSLTVAASDATETTFYVENQALYKKVGSADAVRLTSNDVRVIYAQFTDLTGGDGAGQVRIELRLQYDGYNYVGSPVIQNYVTTVNVGR